MDNSMKYPSSQATATPAQGPAQAAKITSGSALQSPLPAISSPTGGGAIRGIGENFNVNTVTGTASFAIPIATSQSRLGYSPKLALTYDSGVGNGLCGFGWQLSSSSITRKTDKGLPRYQDGEEPDMFTLSGVEDLLPVLEPDKQGHWTLEGCQVRKSTSSNFDVRRYRPRVEADFAQIERWSNAQSGEIHWRTISRDNVTAVYGDTDNSKIFDPEAPARVYSWLLSQSFDDKGNVTKYEYKPENSDGIDCAQAHERMRSDRSRSANRYPKRIKYGNRVSRLVEGFNLETAAWMFEVVFDYGDHDRFTPRASESQPWPSRSDPFSTFRPAFELRTYRLCQRILMIHHFPDEKNVGADCVVWSLDLKYRDSNRENASSRVGSSIGSFMTSVTHTSYLRDGSGYLHKSLPPVELVYTEANISDHVRSLDPESLENLPAGLQDSNYDFVDLDGEGVSGILSRQGDAILYKPNIGKARFGPITSLSNLPYMFASLTPLQQWLDLAGDGDLSLVQLDGSSPGFYKRNKDVPSGWEGFRTFESLPNIPWSDPNVKLIDVRGTGLADALIVNEEIFTYYPGMAEEGFGIAEYWRPPLDEDHGPRILLSDPAESLYLMDMSGDGLMDIVRVRNGEICYWPNLGYGRFGPKISMDNTPWFDCEDLFLQSRLRFGDVDGSGTTDVVYLGSTKVSVFLNQSGNSWTDEKIIRGFPGCSNVDNTQLIDLLGQGTSCLVWSSPLPSNSGQQMRYIDLMSEGKPYLLVSVANNLGSETNIKYRTSTDFYLADKEANRPWATRLPFPVHLVSQVDTLDRINGNRFTTRYAYHEGYFDGVEREFRGFGFIETWDAEDFAKDHANSQSTNFDPTFYNPPVWTKTWYHTGVFVRNMATMNHFKSEFYHEPGLNSKEIDAMLLVETKVPTSVRFGNTYVPHELSFEEARESYRALKGTLIRQETYSLDGTPQEMQPYEVKHNNYVIDMLQPRGPNRYAMYFSHTRESVHFAYERTLYQVSGKLVADPRISHTLNLATDPYGNVLESVDISYGRRHKDLSPQLNSGDKAKQEHSLVSLTLQQFTNAVINPASYRTPLLAESQTFELVKFQRTTNPISISLMRLDEVHKIVKSLGTGQYDLPFEDFRGVGAVANHVYRRRLTRDRTLFRSNDLTSVLELGKLESMALTYEHYTQVLTSRLAEEEFVAKYRFATTKELESALSVSGGYVHSQSDSDWWAPSGRTYFSPKSADSAAAESAFAREHFYLPRRYRDPFYSPSFDTESFARYDKYDLLVIETLDSVGNLSTVGSRGKDPTRHIETPGYDYRLLAPILVMDPNRNRTAAAYDIFGHLTATAVMGKPESTEGDQISGFDLNLPEADVIAYLANPLDQPAKILGNATSRMIYDVWSYFRTKSDKAPLPIVAVTLARETHVSELAPGQKARIQQSFQYSDGFGRSIQTKLLGVRDTVSDLPQWIASGWMVFDNKGSMVRKYEPFFTKTNRYESNATRGVSSTIFYDPLQRVLAKLDPNHTWSKTRWSPWHMETWDHSDTTLIDPSKDPDVSGYFRRLPEVDYKPTWYEARIRGAMGAQEKDAALKAAAHSGTPSRSYFDSLGHSILTLSHNSIQRTSTSFRSDEYYATRLVLDISGNVRTLTDAIGRTAKISSFDMMNHKIHDSSMEAGDKWALVSATGKPIYSWNGRGYQLFAVYDALQRQVATNLRQFQEKQIQVSKTRYGEMESNPEALNLRTRMAHSWDQSVVKRFTQYDFKGNLISAATQFPVEYGAAIDWTAPESQSLESESFKVSSTYDALNHPILVTQPDKSIVKTRYNVVNQVHRVDLKLEGSNEWKSVLVDERYNARNQRLTSRHGNGSHTQFVYDPLTFSLVNLITTRAAESQASGSATSPKPNVRSDVVQDLRYTYDPSLNITHTQDNAQQRIFFKNEVVDPSSSYTYDALYRLVEASGREHLGQSSAHNSHGPGSNGQTSLHSPGDGKAMGTYTESYYMDPVGNMLRLQHSGSDPTQPGWTRRYTYAEPSQIEGSQFSNRLSSITVGKSIESFHYDGNAGLNGNITSMAHHSSMQWDFRDRLQSTATQRNNKDNPDATWYTYVDDGTRMRKVTSTSCKCGGPNRKRAERLYLGPYEIYREFDTKGKYVLLERKTLHIFNQSDRIALIETQTQGEGDGKDQLYRYQYKNNLDSSVLELDESGQLISYEEYYPYGSTSYQAVRSQLCHPKRYRFTGKELDHENGFYYFGARYYDPWSGRWISPDPIGFQDGPNLYIYAKGNPVVLNDPNGTSVSVPPQSSSDSPAPAEGDAGAPAPVQDKPDAGTPPDNRDNPDAGAPSNDQNNSDAGSPATKKDVGAPDAGAKNEPEKPEEPASQYDEHGNYTPEKPNPTKQRFRAKGDAPPAAGALDGVGKGAERLQVAPLGNRGKPSLSLGDEKKLDVEFKWDTLPNGHLTIPEYVPPDQRREAPGKLPMMKYKPIPGPEPIGPAAQKKWDYTNVVAPVFVQPLTPSTPDKTSAAPGPNTLFTPLPPVGKWSYPEQYVPPVSPPRF